jgi:CelD/BcsL family acetyltransferase involved in cellulose biosynthesis
MRALFKLHGARWRKRRLPGVFVSGKIRRFHLSAAEGLLRAGSLRLHALILGEAVVAVLYCLATPRAVCYYAGGFDPGYARHSPGTVLTAHAIDEAAREGAAEFDFLRGDEPYKYAWGAADRANRRVVVARPTVAGQVALRLNGWETKAERAVKRLGRRPGGIMGRRSG